MQALSRTTSAPRPGKRNSASAAPSGIPSTAASVTADRLISSESSTICASSGSPETISPNGQPESGADLLHGHPPVTSLKATHALRPVHDAPGRSEHEYRASDLAATAVALDARPRNPARFRYEQRERRRSAHRHGCARAEPRTGCRRDRRRLRRPRHASCRTPGRDHRGGARPRRRAAELRHLLCRERPVLPPADPGPADEGGLGGADHERSVRRRDRRGRPVPRADPARARGDRRDRPVRPDRPAVRGHRPPARPRHHARAAEPRADGRSCPGSASRPSSLLLLLLRVPRCPAALVALGAAVALAHLAGVGAAWPEFAWAPALPAVVCPASATSSVRSAAPSCRSCRSR